VSIEGDDDLERILVVTGRCKLAIEMRGQIEFLDDESGVARMAPGSYLEIDEKRDGTRRLVEYRPGAGVPEVTWLVDGKPAAFDDEAREWVATMIPMIFRMTGIQAPQRVGRILARGGVEAVLDEVRLIEGDYVQRIYLDQVLAQAELTPGETRDWLSTAGKEVGSDYELAEALIGLPSRDLARAEIQQAFVEAASSIGSDYELRRTLTRLLEQETVSAATLEPMLEAAGTIGSDYECAELLVSIASRFPDGEPLPPSYYAVAASIGSDYEMGRALGQVAGRRMDRESLVSLLTAATDIGSDHELANLLVLVIGEQGIPEGTRADYERALETIGSRYDRGRVLEVWHPAEG
jgi:hypothetical protein